VDEADYKIWLQNLGNKLTGAQYGDFNIDGVVDGIDYIIWVNTYGILQPTPTAIPTPTPAPGTSTPVSCVKTTCYQDLDGDGFRNTTGVTRCVLNGDCSRSLDSYKMNASVPIDCSDSHPSTVNKCCWTLGGVCDSNCNSAGGSTSTKIRKCASSTTCAAATYITCYTGSGGCQYGGVGSCYKKINYNTGGPYYNVCSTVGNKCSLSGSVNCYQGRRSCSWSW